MPDTRDGRQSPSDDADAVEQQTTDADSSSGIGLGDRVVDRDSDDDNPNTAVVVKQHDDRAHEVEIPALAGQTVADVNRGWPADSPVVTVAFETDLDTALDVWRSADAAALARLCDDEGVKTYTYPVARLREVSDE